MSKRILYKRDLTESHKELIVQLYGDGYSPRLIGDHFREHCHLSMNEHFVRGVLRDCGVRLRTKPECMALYKASRDERYKRTGKFAGLK